eukprot:s2155_g8.t1
MEIPCPAWQDAAGRKDLSGFGSALQWLSRHWNGSGATGTQRLTQRLRCDVQREMRQEIEENVKVFSQVGHHVSQGDLISVWHHVTTAEMMGANRWSFALQWLLAAAAAVAIFPSAFTSPRQGKQSSPTSSVLGASRPLSQSVSPLAEEEVQGSHLSFGLVLAAVALAGRSHYSNAKAKSTGIRCVALQATKQTTAQPTQKEEKTEKQELAKKSEVPSDLDWSQVSSQWEVDCFSRPINREGKKMWEFPKKILTKSSFEISGDFAMEAATLTAPPGLEPDVEAEAAPAGTAAGARRKFFDPHLEPEAIEDGLASGSLIRGTIRVSSSKVSMAFVRPEGAKSQDREWVVRGTKYRNRAVHGDTVIIQPILYGRTEDQGWPLFKVT